MINSFGLYKSNVPRWKITGLKSDKRLDDQTQDWWYPFFEKMEIFIWLIPIILSSVAQKKDKQS